jgi:hypothetical protein
MNSFSKNKEIVEICKNYYTIVNTELYEGDEVTSNIIKLYEDYIFGMEIVTKREKEKLALVDRIMLKFISDVRFRKEMCEHLGSLRVSKGVNNLVEYVMNKMIVFFEDYKDMITRNIYVPRWI